MTGSQRALAVATILLATMAVGGVVSAATMGQRLGVGAGPGYHSGCPCNSFPTMGYGCCEVPPRWTYHVWRGYECEHPNWWYYGRPRHVTCQP